ncbi:glycosyltransferase [Ferroplasma acidiphilum]|uniref:glycosyltransferase n=1 Tax=Ferroplasma acidiphilum TaxID=74969 RepID=UPI0023F47047|nr:glycosyltransferase [Ferroplasma acidiphilum]MCL4348905.1 glycosyltransferase [Candidatus Thermoplasmatota archaeon]
MEGISAIITVLNEEKNIRDLMVSLISQEQPFEVIVVDSMSTDKTPKILKEYAEKYDFVKYYRKKTTRGGGRNYGASKSNYDYLAFIDGDAIAGEAWIKNLRALTQNYNLVAGKSINTGNMRYSMERFRLYYGGFEVTRPSSNLMYSKSLFQSIGGFDENFVTAEDIDMNIRAVKSGAKYAVCDTCIVYTKTRETFRDFKKQAYWNGYGRRQLKEKYGKTLELSHRLNMKDLFSPTYVIRNFYGLRGYMHCMLKSKK